jgi:hypothetical protein
VQHRVEEQGVQVGVGDQPCLLDRRRSPVPPHQDRMEVQRDAYLGTAGGRRAQRLDREPVAE